MDHSSKIGAVLLELLLRLALDCDAFHQQIEVVEFKSLVEVAPMRVGRQRHSAPAANLHVFPPEFRRLHNSARGAVHSFLRRTSCVAKANLAMSHQHERHRCPERASRSPSLRRRPSIDRVQRNRDLLRFARSKFNPCPADQALLGFFCGIGQGSINLCDLRSGTLTSVLHIKGNKVVLPALTDSPE